MNQPQQPQSHTNVTDWPLKMNLEFYNNRGSYLHLQCFQSNSFLLIELHDECGGCDVSCLRYTASHWQDYSPHYPPSSPAQLRTVLYCLELDPSTSYWWSFPPHNHHNITFHRRSGVLLSFQTSFVSHFVKFIFPKNPWLQDRIGCHHHYGSGGTHSEIQKR